MSGIPVIAGGAAIDCKPSVVVGGVEIPVYDGYVIQGGQAVKIYQAFHAVGTGHYVNNTYACASSTWGADGALDIFADSGYTQQDTTTVTAELVFDDPIPISGTGPILSIVANYSSNPIVWEYHFLVQAYDSSGAILFANYSSYGAGKSVATSMPADFVRADIKSIKFTLIARLSISNIANPDAFARYLIPAGGIVIGNVEQHTVDSIDVNNPA